ncbi:PIN domain-containing protein [Nocardia salmonicida]|uniref:PIN domain-containing protein n=1 Tax=Nocardia salmonicida TaxID=53431 RepID=UPI0034020EB5
MPTIIVLDANILVASPRLQNRTWQSLVEHRDDWDVRIVVPEVAVMEAAKNVPVKWASTRNELPLPKKFREFGHEGTLQAVLDEVDAQIGRYADDLDERLTAMGAEIVAPPAAADLMGIARRAAEARAPYGAGVKDGFRDTVIWLSVIELAHDNPGAEVWFVSNNTRDFGPAEAGDWTGPGTGDRDECPILFHADLIDDLEGLGLGERVHYVTNINSLERHLAAQFAPITSEDLRARIDEDQLIKQFGASVRQWPLDPYFAALDPNTVTAVVSSAAPVADSWQFHDAAQRDEMGLTARFTVTADTVIAWTSAEAPNEIAVQEKQLSVTGDVTIGADGAVVLEPSAVAALPDDPMRKMWPLPADVVRAQQTAVRAQKNIVRILNEAGPYDNPARIKAEVDLWQETATGANRILDSDAVQRTLSELRGALAPHVSVSQILSEQRESPAPGTSPSPSQALSLSQMLSELRELPAPGTSPSPSQALSVSQWLTELWNSPPAQVSVDQTYAELNGMEAYSMALRRAFDAWKRESQRAAEPAPEPESTSSPEETADD